MSRLLSVVVGKRRSMGIMSYCVRVVHVLDCNSESMPQFRKGEKKEKKLHRNTSYVATRTPFTFEKKLLVGG